MEKFEKAFAFITQFIRSLLPKAEFTRANVEHLRVESGGVSEILTFGIGELEDLETVLERHQPRRYSNGIKNQIKFLVYIALGSRGMIPHVRMSEAMLDDEREWSRSVSVVTRFDATLANRLYFGLKALEEFLTNTLANHGEIEGVRKDLEIVLSLTAWYEERNNLNDREVKRDSLSYLKAAAVLAIRELEIKKDSTAVARVRANYDEQILSIVGTFQMRPFDRIELPSALREYLAEQAQAAGSSPSAAGQPPSDKQSQLDVLLNKLNPRFVERRHGAWEALRSHNPDHVSQAANSMVELLDQVIDTVCDGAKFKDILKERLNSDEDSEWVLATRAWIGVTKSNLHRVKHHTEAQSKQLAEDLFSSAETIMRLILR